MMRKLPDKVERDLETMRQQLGCSLRRLALFGSILHVPYSRARDVDVAVFVDGISLYEAKKTLESGQLSHELFICSANGKYRTPKPQFVPAGKYYHVVLLEEKAPNNRFMSINRGSLRTVWTAEEKSWSHNLRCVNLAISSLS